MDNDPLDKPVHQAFSHYNLLNVIPVQEEHVMDMPAGRPWRMNLCAASQRDPLTFFVAMSHYILVYKIDHPSAKFKDPIKRLGCCSDPTRRDPEFGEDFTINAIKVGRLLDTEVLVSVSNVGEICVWRTDALDERPFTLDNHSSTWGIALHGDQGLLAVSANSWIVTIYNIPKLTDKFGQRRADVDYVLPANTETMSLVGHQNNIPCIDFSSSGRYLASCSIDKTCRIWDLKTRHEVAKRSFHLHPRENDAWCWSVKFIPSGYFKYAFCNDQHTNNEIEKRLMQDRSTALHAVNLRHSAGLPIYILNTMSPTALSPTDTDFDIFDESDFEGNDIENGNGPLTVVRFDDLSRPLQSPRAGRESTDTDSEESSEAEEEEEEEEEEEQQTLQIFERIATAILNHERDGNNNPQDNAHLDTEELQEAYAALARLLRDRVLRRGGAFQSRQELGMRMLHTLRNSLLQVLGDNNGVSQLAQDISNMIEHGSTEFMDEDESQQDTRRQRRIPEMIPVTSDGWHEPVGTPNEPQDHDNEPAATANKEQEQQEEGMQMLTDIVLSEGVIPNVMKNSSLALDNRQRFGLQKNDLDEYLMLTTAKDVYLLRTTRPRLKSERREHNVVSDVDVRSDRLLMAMDRLNMVEWIPELELFVAASQKGTVALMRVLEVELWNNERTFIFNNEKYLPLSGMQRKPLYGMTVQRAVTDRMAPPAFLLYLFYYDGAILAYRLSRVADQVFASPLMI